MPLTIASLTPADLDHHADSLAALLVNAVNHGASVSFLPPLSLPAAADYWRTVRAALADQRRILLAAFEQGAGLVGSLQLDLAWQPNAPHRAEIQKVLVHTAHRRKGIASHLLSAAETHALAAGRWLLVLDTERGLLGAQPLYEKHGYTQAGAIPRFALNAHGHYADTILYYKVLPQP